MMDDQPTLTGSPDAGMQPAAQPPASPGGTPSPSAGVPAQVDRLSALLAEADAEVSRTPNPSSPPTPTSPDPNSPAPDRAVQDALREIRDYRQQTVAERTEQDISSMIGNWQTSDDVLKGVDQGLIKALLNDEARADPRLANAFLARKQNPGRWQQIETAIRTKVSQRLASVPNSQISADRRAAANAGAGISATQPGAIGPKSAREISEMNDNEFARYKANQMRGA